MALRNSIYMVLYIDQQIYERTVVKGCQSEVDTRLRVWDQVRALRKKHGRFKVSTNNKLVQKYCDDYFGYSVAFLSESMW